MGGFCCSSYDNDYRGYYSRPVEDQEEIVIDEEPDGYCSGSEDEDNANLYYSPKDNINDSISQDDGDYRYYGNNHHTNQTDIHYSSELQVERYSFIPQEARDVERDFDYTNTRKKRKETCGYIRPFGWKKLALKVKGKYDDDDWFRGKKSLNTGKEWAVSYHGPKDHNTIPNIIRLGYDISKNTRSQYGTGIYSSPHLEEAERYGESFKYDGKQIKVLFMNRVHKSYTKKVNGGRFFLTTDDRKIRPIAVLMKTVC